MRKTALLVAICSGFGLSACSSNDSDLERGLIGAAIGCAAGEILVDAKCVEGAAVGAGVGVLTN